MKDNTEYLREEFESTIGEIFPSLNFIWIEDEQKYMPFDTHLCWTTWVEAKRAQPIVVLPAVIDIYTEDIAGNFYDEDAVNERLTAAGIKYTIGE